MKNLGKIALFLLLLVGNSYAMVTASVEPQRLQAGDSATYMLTITGSDIKKPLLSDICGNTITATGSQTSIQSINGDYKKSYTLTYEFTPTKSCTIEPVAVSINSKKEMSNSVNVIVKPRTQDVNADFTLTYSASKTNLFVGEPFTLTLLLKQKLGAQAVDSKFIAPDFKGFWMKSQSKPQRSNENGDTITKIVYKLAPQRAGKLDIEAAKLQIARRVSNNNWGSLIPQVKWRTYYSNTLTIDAKALPNNAKIIGHFTIAALADKTQTNPNAPVNVVVKVVGDGDLEDIESFKPYVKDVNVFDEKIAIQNNTLSQKLVFVGENNFTIPSFELAYFDTKTKSVRKIKTDPIPIQVNGGVAKSEVKIQRDESAPVKETQSSSKNVPIHNNYLLVAVAFIVGIAVGVLLMLALKIKKSENKKIKLDLKNEKLLLIKLLPFKDEDTQVAEIVTKLEGNIYGEKREAIDKKLLKELIQRYEIS